MDSPFGSFGMKGFGLHLFAQTVTFSLVFVTAIFRVKVGSLFSRIVNCPWTWMYVTIQTSRDTVSHKLILSLLEQKIIHKWVAKSEVITFDNLLMRRGICMNECCGQKHLARNGTRPCYSLVYVKLHFHIRPKIDHNKANCQIHVW